MIKVKTFISNSTNPLHHDRLDNQINAFLAANDIEVVDIKYSTSAAVVGSGVNFYPSALLIYKTKE